MKTATSMRHALAAARGGQVRAASTIAGVRRGITATAAARRSGVAGGARTTAAPLRVSGTRAFSVSARRAEGAFDPATVERESDEVDVCIVGGGMSIPSPFPAPPTCQQTMKRGERSKDQG